MKNLVALVVDPSFGAKLGTLEPGIPIWIVESDINCNYRLELRSSDRAANLCRSVTWFKSRHGEGSLALSLRMIPSLDDHYNEYSQRTPYSELHIYGLDSELGLTAALSDLGFISSSLLADTVILRKARAQR